MNPILLFLASTVLSFAGSLQLGPVNSQVLRRAIAGKTRFARLTALGGALPEILYATLAAVLANQLNEYEALQDWFRWIFILFFTGIGLFLLLKKPKVEAPLLKGKSPRNHPFVQGFLLGILNPQLIFFWSGILVYLDSGSLNFFQIGAFALGAFTGAYVLLIGLSRLGKTLANKKFFQEQNRVDKLIGAILLGIGLFEGVKYLFF